jgi:Methylamine utilisation protein MauE
VVLISLVSAAALLLAAAGLAKLRQPSPTRSALAAAGIPGAQRLGAKTANRLSGAGELAIAAVALLVGGRVAAASIALAYLVLAVLSARMMRIESGQDCGCFAKPVAVSHWHTAVNLSCMLAGLVALLAPANSLIDRLGHAPLTGSALLLAAAVLAYLAYLVMTALPELNAAAAALEAAR